MDVDVFIAAHRAEWDRLDALVRRGGRLSGDEADELVVLYQRVATHLSTARSAVPDPALIGKLSTLVARARSAVTSTRSRAWKDAADFFTVRFPAAVYHSRHWWISVAVAFTVVSIVVAWWVAANPHVQASIAAPAEIRELTRPGGEFESYYSSHPAEAFAAQVWTNNAWIAASSLVSGVLLGIPILIMLVANALNVAVSAGLMASVGRLDVFFGLITPHGLLELTAVFVAAGTGLRLGWTVIDPGPRTRAHALAAEGRSAVGIAVGLAGVLLVSGVIEAFVTPSPLPTWVRIGIGVLAEAVFLGYVFILGRRAAAAGETGDLDAVDRGDARPTAA